MLTGHHFFSSLFTFHCHWPAMTGDLTSSRDWCGIYHIYFLCIENFGFGFRASFRRLYVARPSPSLRWTLHPPSSISPPPSLLSLDIIELLEQTKRGAALNSSGRPFFLLLVFCNERIVGSCNNFREETVVIESFSSTYAPRN